MLTSRGADIVVFKLTIASLAGHQTQTTSVADINSSKHSDLFNDRMFRHKFTSSSLERWIFKLPFSCNFVNPATTLLSVSCVARTHFVPKNQVITNLIFILFNAKHSHFLYQCNYVTLVVKC